MKFILQPTKSAGIDNKMTITSLSPVTSFAGYTNARDIFDEQLYQNFSEGFLSSFFSLLWNF